VSIFNTGDKFLVFWKFEFINILFIILIYFFREHCYLDNSFSQMVFYRICDIFSLKLKNVFLYYTKATLLLFNYLVGYKFKFLRLFLLN